MAYAKPNKKYNTFYLYNSQNKYIKPLGKITKEQAKQIVVEWEKRNEAPMPNGHFDIIYADPPWRYDFSKSKSRAIESHYKTMELEDICKLKIPAKEDSILFLWATAPKIIEALKVMESWGFTYKTNLVWIKNKMGMGYYVRGRHELLLIGAKGKSKIPATADRQDSVIIGERTKHSKKPESVYNIIETAYPNCKYLELFARNKRPGWETWGNEISN